jgi:HD-GYP domain-containing protein (c-di-GMP phosphodiesterase class II)
LIARIVTAADVWDACTSTRPYSKAMAASEALEVVRKLGGNQLDPSVTEAMIRVIERRRASADRPPDVAA